MVVSWQECGMVGVIRRVVVCALVLALVVGSMGQVSAETSGSVTVTGEVVAVPLSITIFTSDVSFGNIDYKATEQTSDISAKGFEVANNNGAQWVANTPIDVSIESPGPFTSTVCTSSQTGLPTNGFYIMDTIPAGPSDAATKFSAPNASVMANCTPGTTWKSGTAGVHPYSAYLGLWIQMTHDLQTFTATVTFSVSAS